MELRQIINLPSLSFFINIYKTLLTFLKKYNTKRLTLSIHVPNLFSKRVEIESMSDENKSQVTGLNKTVGQGLQENLTIKQSQYAKSTYEAYCRKSHQLAGWFKKRFKNKTLSEITATDMELFVVWLLERYRGNTVNHYLEILRAVFARAKADGLMTLNPMGDIKKCKYEIEEPQPFLKKEITLLLQRQDAHPIEVALIQLGLATGVRISELMAVSVECIDLDKKTLTVDLALVDGAYKVPKTKGSLRKIELTKSAMEAAQILIEQASHRKPKTITVTQADNRTKKSLRRTLLAYNRSAKRPYASVDEYREKFFKPHCILMGVEYRGPSQLRHTYASQLLSAGVNVEWIARQMGHTGTAMIERHYGKWLTEDAADFGAKAEVALHDCIHGDAEPAEALKLVQATSLPADLNALKDNPQLEELFRSWIHQKLGIVA